MKPTAWQRLRSHLWPVPLRTLRTARHPRLYLQLVRGRYQLSTANAVYSFGDLYVNFTEAFRLLDLARLPGRKVLVLGLGLGSVIELLENRHHFAGIYTAVEFDEAIIELARAFTLDDIGAPIAIIAANAEDFLREGAPGGPFDLILMDIFFDVLIPPFFSTGTCADLVSAALAPGGLLIENRLYRTRKDKADTMDYYRKVFFPRHPAAICLDVDGNRMLVQDGAYLAST
jgi:predicted O-methyltransferase YrrM